MVETQWPLQEAFQWKGSVYLMYGGLISGECFWWFMDLPSKNSAWAYLGN